LIVGLVVVFILEWHEADVIRSSEDVERHTGLPVLGLIPSTVTQAARARERRREAAPFAAAR